MICDKYDLTRALKAWNAVWLLRWQEDLAGEPYWPDMLAMAAFFANNQAFYLISTKLLESSPTKSLFINHDLQELTDVVSPLLGKVLLASYLVRC